VPDTSLEEISNTNLNTAAVAKNNNAGGDADLSKDRSSGLSKTPNETSKMIETAKDDSGMVGLADEKNTTEETETKRNRLTCRICEENEAVVTFKPCGHTILCTGIQMTIPIEFDLSLSIRKTGRRMEDYVFCSLKTVTGSFICT